jgi:hypothetical protein
LVSSLLLYIPLIQILPMARRARLNVARALNFVFGDKFFALFKLIRRRDPVRVENFRTRANVFFGLAMAIETERHVQSLRAIHQGHLRDLAMAGGAADAFIDVNAVVEINELRERVDAGPR